MIFTIINTVLTFLTILIFARAILSWIRISPDSPFFPVVRFIHEATEPLLAPIRRVMPATSGMDLSPLILLMIIYLARMLLGSIF
jgi:YggT family protein